MEGSKPRIGVHPLSWTNNVIPEFGGDTPAETFFSDAAQAGYAGVEMGINVPTDPAALEPMLAAHGLQLVTGWYSGFLADRGVEEELQEAASHAGLLEKMGARVMVYGECGSMAPGDALNEPMSRRVPLTDIDAQAYAGRVTDFATQLTERYGLQLVYHHHLMMVVETPAELDRFMELTGPAVGLLFDTGHYAAGGGDIAAPLQRHGDRIRHIHLKDIRAEVLADIRRRDASFNQGVREGIFTVPGDGSLDFSPVAEFAAASGYDGWLVVEAEQDPAKEPPLPTVTRARAHVRKVFGL